MTALLSRFNQYNAAIRSRYTGKAYERSLPNVPSMGDSPGTFAAAAQKAEAHWLMVNASLSSIPLLLGAGTAGDPAYSQAQFTTDLAALRSATAIAQASEQKLRMFIEKRNDVQDDIAPLLRDYRQAVASRFPGPHAFLDSLPRFSPVPGNKPDAPEITSSGWNAATSQADITFTPSTSTDVETHELRICPGPDYDADLETLDATLAVGQPPVFHSSSLLATPGAVVSYKVYAITNDERENDSEPATVQRPVV